MKILSYVPKAVQEGKFKGVVEIDHPSVTMKYKFINLLSFKFDGGQVDANEVANSNVKNMGIIIEATKEHYRKVDLSHEDGTKYTSFEDLNSDPECEGILMEIAGLYLGGYIPSKNLNP